MPSSLLAGLYDPGLAVTADSPAELERAEVERLRLLQAVATSAAAIPRRVGIDASDIELALDKKRCKRVAWVAAQCLRAWKIEPTAPAPASANGEAAQVRWDKWWEQHNVWLTNRVKYVATWGMAQTDERNQVWAKSTITRLQNEQRWLAYAMRG